MFVWYNATTYAVIYLSVPPFTVVPPQGETIMQIADAPLPGPVSQLRLTADLMALEVDPAKVPAPLPNGKAFVRAMIAALGNDFSKETAVSRAYPQFFAYVDFENWPRVQQCITDALATNIISQSQYTAIKAAAATCNIPVTL